MRQRRALRIIAILAAAALVVCLGVYLMIRRNCCDQLNAEEVGRLQARAKAGDVAAMKRLSLFFEESGDSEEADAWLTRAANTGDAEAEFDFWDRSVGIQKVAAISYLRRSAAHGYPLAQVTLGELYRAGVNVPKDIQTAKYWLGKSARAGEPSGVLALCDLAVAERDVEQCRECIELEGRAIATLKPKSSYALQLERQRGRIQDILRQASRQ